MSVSPSFSPQTFIRSIITLLFFGGGIFLIFWIQGFRIDLTQHGIVPTTVLVVNTPSHSRIFIDGQEREVSHGVILGIPLGMSSVCLVQERREMFCEDVLFRENQMSSFGNITLLPLFFSLSDWGEQKDIIWKEHEHVFMRFFSDIGFLRIVPNIQESPLLSGSLFSFHVPNISSEKPTNPLRKTGDSGILYFVKHNLFFRETVSGTTHTILHFPEEIENAFFLPNSVSFLVATTTKIFFFPHKGAVPKEIFQKDSATAVRFFEKNMSLFWEKNGHLVSTFL